MRKYERWNKEREKTHTEYNTNDPNNKEISARTVLTLISASRESIVSVIIKINSVTESDSISVLISSETADWEDILGGIISELVSVAMVSTFSSLILSVFLSSFFSFFEFSSTCNCNAFKKEKKVRMNKKYNRGRWKMKYLQKRFLRNFVKSY